MGNVSTTEQFKEMLLNTIQAAALTFMEYKASHFKHFESIDVSLVRFITIASPSKHYSLDLLPMWLMKDCISILCLASRRWSMHPCKLVIFHCRFSISNLNKPTDGSDPFSCQPVFNLKPIIGKMLKKLTRLGDSVMMPPNFSVTQSAYRASHCTEMATLQATTYQRSALDCQQSGKTRWLLPWI